MKEVTEKLILFLELAVLGVELEVLHLVKHAAHVATAKVTT